MHDVVAWNAQQNEGYIVCGEILLMLDALIDRDEYVEIAINTAKKLSIRITAQTCIGYCQNQATTAKVPFDATRNALIEQNAQLTVPSLAQALRLPDHEKHSESPRGSRRADARLRGNPEVLEMEHVCR